MTSYSRRSYEILHVNLTLFDSSFFLFSFFNLLFSSFSPFEQQPVSKSASLVYYENDGG